MNINTRDATAIIEALSGGVVPRRGLQHLMVGRNEESNQIYEDLKDVKEGSSKVKFFIGDFGSGKSFIQGLTKQIALRLNFVVTKADFSPEIRLSGSSGQAVALYTELVKNLSTPTSPEGNALPIILDKWITSLQKKIVKEKGYDSIDFSNESFVRDVEDKITQEGSKLDKLSDGYDFSIVLNIYYRGFVQGNTDIQRKALRWIRGEYSTKTEARNDLGIRDIIHDGNYYNYIKVLSQFAKQVGYSGLVINFDEAINLYKMTHRQARERNYETLLTMFNDSLQGSLTGLYITFSGTHEFLKDERRGLYSYGALRRRLETNRYETEDHRDLTQPVINLTPLKSEDLFSLLKRLKDIYAIHYKYEANVIDDEIKSFIKKEFSVPGSKQYTTVGHVVKRFIDALNILYQNPELIRSDIFGNGQKNTSRETNATSNVMNRFSKT